ncbi:MAG: hypothetical protein ACLFPM_00550 [Candidatus Izemoplasmatales bacterium]
MKKFFGNLYIFISLLLVSLVAIPWNNFNVWGLQYNFLTTLRNNEFKIKLGIFIFLFIISLIFLIISNKEHKKNNEVTRLSAYATTVPIIGYCVAFLSHLTYMIYTDTNLALGIGVSNMNSIYLLAGLGLILLSLILSPIFIKSFRKVRVGVKTFYFFMFSFFAGLFALLAYAFKTYRAEDYFGMSAKYMALIIPLVLVVYIICVIVNLKHKEKHQFDSYDEQDDFDQSVLSSNKDIASQANRIEPNENLYQAVNVDPEFSKQNKQRNKPNSIEYYIEKPKMFKPLNPTFDKLVQHVKEFPDVITKMDEEKITFYVSRTPFLVLMNYGDYYRMAFRYELEEGIRLIIKYPTISKNKSTREELWFKANNYGDLPKEIIYKIVKNAYDLVSR